jgi:hypothetical protein
MKAPRKAASVKMNPEVRAAMKRQQTMEIRMRKVSDDQVWIHENGTEYTTILLTNEHATKKDSYPVTVCYYAEGKYWSQTLERFVQDKSFVRNYESVMTPAEKTLAPWISGGISDPDTCAEFKTAAENWLNELPIPKLV